MKVFTTHTWLNDGKAVVCTQKGEITLLSGECEFIAFLNDRNIYNWHIESIIPFSKGFIVGGDGLTVHIFEATHDETVYYTKGPTISVIILMIVSFKLFSQKMLLMLKKPELPHSLLLILLKTKSFVAHKTIPCILSI